MKKYHSAIADLDQRGIMPDRIPSLEPTQAGLEAIGFFTWPLWQKIQKNPETVIVVAGTNGKGSTCATLEALLIDAGERVGLYTSPHLMEITERIRISGTNITEDIFVQAYEYVAQHTQHLKLSHFEMLTLMSLWCFASGQVLPVVDRILLEVGMGGTWDATNAVPHGIAIITSLAIDHERFLGSELSQIARNKFGIIGPKMRVFHQVLPEVVKPVAKEVQQKTQSRWTQALTLSSKISQTASGPEWIIQYEDQEQALQLPGPRGVENTILALTVFQGLGYDVKKHLSALNKVSWPGRMEKISYKNFHRIYLSGDHNAQGLESLLALLPSYNYEHLHIVVGIGVDKDYEFILSQLKKLKNARIYLTETPFKGRKLESYGPYLQQADYCNANFEEVFEYAIKQCQPNDMLLVTGSLYLVGDIRKYITR
ncbi:MAG: folylpolyglutamate synthase/dihydrofolate synthase family protein [Bdellovibrionales bacterium]